MHATQNSIAVTGISDAHAKSNQATEKKTISIITWKLVPFLCLLYLIAYIDRQNVSFAKLQMANSLGMSEVAFGLGASLFFIGYLIFEVPSNIILSKVGARVWLSRIIFTWGLITVALAFTQNATMFYMLRFLLGAAEAGFFPGVLYLLTLWYPQQYRGRVIGLFMMAGAVANMIGAPLGGMLLELDGVMGLRGWEWIFLVTGVPAVIVSFFALFLLSDDPLKASFLDAEQKTWLTATLAKENLEGRMDYENPFRALLDKRVIMLSLYALPFPLAVYGLGYWLPTVVKSFDVSSAANGFINILPWACAAVALWLLPLSSAYFNERRWHLVIPVMLSAVCLTLSVFVPGNSFKFALLCVGVASVLGAQPIFWSLTQGFLTGAGAAAGLAMINSFGNLGGFIAQNAMPGISHLTGSQLAPMIFIAVCVASSAALTFPLYALLKAPVPGAQARQGGR